MKEKTQRVKPNQVKLLNGCYRSQITVTPSNWNEKGASLERLWYYSYRFYDPFFKEHPQLKKGKQVVIKGGVNEYHTLTERRQLMSDLVAMETKELDEKGYNPITKQYMEDEAPKGNVVEYEVHPNTPFRQAMQKAYKLAEEEKDDKDIMSDIRSVLKFVLQASKKLQYDTIPVKDIRRSHATLIIKTIGVIKGKGKWTNNNYNYHRKWFRSLFETLANSGTVEDNPVDKIPTKIVIRQIREALTDEQREAISKYIPEIDYCFWRFMNIFYGAGSRTTEIMLVQAKNVDLVNQKFKAVIRKGATNREVHYTISDLSLKYWREIMSEVQHPDDYVFAKGLRPGAAAINPKQITRRWYKWIKTRLSNDRVRNGLSRITADWYSLKHLHTTDVVSKLGIKAAADYNNESEKMIDKVYDLLSPDRKHQARKKLNNQFVPVRP